MQKVENVPEEAKKWIFTDALGRKLHKCYPQVVYLNSCSFTLEPDWVKFEW